MVIPEALSMGIPCIATSGTPWEELNSRNCGWWIDSSKDSIAKAIEYAIETNIEDYKLMANNAINLVKEKYSIDKTVDELINLYKRLV